MKTTIRNQEHYEELVELARKEEMTVAGFAKMIVIEDFGNAGYSGNDEWFDQFSEESFIEEILNNWEHFEENYFEDYKG